MNCSGFFGAIASSRDVVEDEDEAHLEYVVERWYLRDRFDIMNMEDKKFIESFRINKEIFKYLIEELRPHISDGKRTTIIPLEIKLAAVLNFLATGSYQRTVGDILLHTMDQSVVSRAITNIIDILESTIRRKFIKFPHARKKQEYIQIFFEKTSHPGIIGCVDCTHVLIIAPQNEEHTFDNRKGNHSLNVQLICNYNLEILSVCATYPGSAHDSAIWALSPGRQVMKRNYENGERNTWLLGDSGYPLEPWLLTPYWNPLPIQQRYNYLHAQARNPIERCNGVLKNTFRFLLGERVLRYEPLKAIKIINVCCALFNICLQNKIDMAAETLPTNSTDQQEAEFEYNSEENDTAALIRNGLLNCF